MVNRNLSVDHKIRNITDLTENYERTADVKVFVRKATLSYKPNVHSAVPIITRI